MFNLSQAFKRGLTLISPKLNTRIVYFAKFRSFIKLKHPVTLDEKIQWLKFNTYYGNSLVTRCADKFAVRQYVAECGCEEILNDLYGVYDSVDEIDWDTLPDKFVLKWNFGCGHNIICRDKKVLDIEAAKCKLNDWKKQSKTFYLTYAEMQYKGIPPKIICEKLIETKDHLLPLDYKLYCFNGQAKYCMLCTNRETGHPEYYFFDRNKTLCRFNKRGLSAPKNFSIPMPEGYDRLFEYANKLVKDFPFVRADFYLEQGQVIFGELTFTPCGGYDVNIPFEQNKFLGDQVKLPTR